MGTVNHKLNRNKMLNELTLWAAQMGVILIFLSIGHDNIVLTASIVEICDM